MQMHVDLCWFIIPWSSLMWPKDYLNMCHVFYYNFSVNFLQSTWIRPSQKNLPNQDSNWDDITCQSPSSKHYHFKRQGYVGQPVLSALSQWHDTIHLQKKGIVKVYSWNARLTKHLPLTIWYSDIYWNDNVYWMVIDKWCHLKNLGLEDFLWAYPSTLKKFNRKIIINYMAHI